MCGICGFVSATAWPEDMLRGMNDVIVRRGPDGEDEAQAGGWMDAAAELADPAGHSFTEPREEA